MAAGAAQVTIAPAAFSAALMRLSFRKGAADTNSVTVGRVGAGSAVALMTITVRLTSMGVTTPLTSTRQIFVPRGTPVTVQVRPLVVQVACVPLAKLPLPS